MTQKGFEVTKSLTSGQLKNVIEHVVIGKDQSIEEDFSTRIENYCLEKNIQYSFRNEHFTPKNDNYVFAISWRWMIDHPESRLIVFHDSLLPKYRGFAPLVNSLINGESEIGVSAILGAKEYDRGALIGQAKKHVAYPIKIQEAIDLNMENFLTLANEIAETVLLGKDIESTPQTGAPTYSIWRDEKDYFINWNDSAEQIKRFVDAVGKPYSGARTKTSRGDTIIVEEVTVVPDVFCELRHIGKVIFVEDGNPVIICGKGLIKICSAKYETEGQKSFLPMKGFRLRFS